jgi:2-dehydropantoate 2-reductase
VIDTSVLIVGGGAIGGVCAGLMSGKVRQVTVLDANAEHVRRLRDPGLLLDLDEGSRTVVLDAHGSAGELSERYEFALITVKFAHLEVAVRAVADAGVAETYVSLGNGLVQDHVTALVGEDRMIAGTVELGATNLGPGHVRRTTSNPFVIGELDGRTSHRLDRLRDVLATVDGVRVTDNIRGQIWSKLLINSTFSGLGAIGGGLYADVAAHPAGRRAIVGVWTEGYRIGMEQQLELEQVLGIEPVDLAAVDDANASPTAATERAIDTVVGLAGATKASMLQDIERGVACEVDVINGAVAQRARRLGTQAPLNERIVELMHSCERGERRPSPELFERVLDAA